MKSIAKNNLITIFGRFRENLKDFSSVLTGIFSQLDGNDVSLNDFSESDSNIIDELIKSSAKIDQQANEFVLNIGVPSIPKHKTKKTIKVNESTVIKPIINKTISNDKNISLINNRNEIERD